MGDPVSNTKGAPVVIEVAVNGATKRERPSGTAPSRSRAPRATASSTSRLTFATAASSMSGPCPSPGRVP